MTPMPPRDPAPQAQGEGPNFMDSQPPQGEQPPQGQQAEQDSQELLKGKLNLFRSADEMIENLSRASQSGGKYAQGLKDLLKKWMLEEVASTRERSPKENPRLFGA